MTDTLNLKDHIDATRRKIYDVMRDVADLAVISPGLKPCADTFSDALTEFEKWDRAVYP